MGIVDSIASILIILSFIAAISKWLYRRRYNCTWYTGFSIYRHYPRWAKANWRNIKDLDGPRWSYRALKKWANSGTTRAFQGNYSSEEHRQYNLYIAWWRDCIRK